MVLCPEYSQTLKCSIEQVTSDLASPFVMVPIAMTLVGHTDHMECAHDFLVLRVFTWAWSLHMGKDFLKKNKNRKRGVSVEPAAEYNSGHLYSFPLRRVVQTYMFESITESFHLFKVWCIPLQPKTKLLDEKVWHKIHKIYQLLINGLVHENICLCWSILRGS